MPSSPQIVPASAVGSAEAIADVEMAPVPGSAETGARGSQEPSPTEPVAGDFLRIPIDAPNTYASELRDKISEVESELGPRGECAGYGAINTELRTCTDNTHRFKVTFQLPDKETILARDAMVF